MPDPPVRRSTRWSRAATSLAALSGLILLGATGVASTAGVTHQSRPATAPVPVAVSVVPASFDTIALPAASTVDSVNSTDQPAPVVVAAAQAPAAPATLSASIPGTKLGFQGSLTLSYDPQNGWQLKFAPLTDRFSLGTEASASITGTLALPGWTPKRLFSQVPGLTGTANAAQPPTPDTTTPDTTTPDTTTPDTTTPAVPDTTTPVTPDTDVPATPPADTGTTTPAEPAEPVVPAAPVVPDAAAPVTPVITDPMPALPDVSDPTPALPVYTPSVPDIPAPVDVSSDLGNGLGSTGSDLGNGLDSGTDLGVSSDLGNGLGSVDTGGVGSFDSGGSFSSGDSGE